MSLHELAPDQLAELQDKVKRDYEQLESKKLQLDLTRGKPSKEQLDLAADLLEMPGRHNYTDAQGNDLRNYGNLKGITDIRNLWADLLHVRPENLLAGDSSSLNIEFDLISWAYTFGTPNSDRPWSQEEKVKWICPVPGYDRHHSITELFGFEMVNVPMREDGPDLDRVRGLVKDPQVKGMWTVPTFSNPTGVSYSEEVVRELAAMETAAPDFRIVWDNAYAVHTLNENFPDIYPVLDYAAEANHPNRFWVMSSTSKITFAGAGVAFFASSPANIDWYCQIASKRGIGPNKLNQLAHAEYFASAEGVRAVMRRHASILGPKFETVLDILDKRLGGLDVASWTRPEGGYFISLYTPNGTAHRVWELAKNGGIVLTQAGSAYPYGKDPDDHHIRLAPSMPEEDDVKVAMEGVATCVLYAALEKLDAGNDPEVAHAEGASEEADD